MKSKFFSVALIVFLSCQAQSFDYKQDAKALKKKLSRRSQASLTEQTHKLMTRAQEDLNAGDDKTAFKLFEKLLKRTQKTPSEQAQVLQALAYAYAQKEQNDKALKTFEKALDLDALPQTPTLSVMYIIGQIHALKGNHAKSVEVLILWLKLAPSPSGQAYAMLAGSLYELKKKKKALEAIQKAIDLTAKPKESWLSMAVSLYFANDRYKEAAQVLKILVAQNPKKESYWKQWAASHLSADEEKQALVAMELGNINGSIKSDKDILNASSLMMSTDIPYKAAMWIEKKMSKSERLKLKNQKILASAYMSARENKKALNVLRNIHKNSPEAKTSLQLGQVLLEQEVWEEAKSVFDKVKKLAPDEAQKEQLYVGLGVAYFNLGDTKLSRESFVKVADKSETAQGWLKFIQTQTKEEI